MPDAITPIGYRSPQVAALTGATFKEVTHWRHIGLVRPSIHDGRNSGDHHRWSTQDVHIIRTVVILRRAGISLDRIRRTQIIAVLSSPWHGWQGWLIITPWVAVITTNPAEVAEIIAGEATPVAVLNLADVTLLDMDAHVA